MTTSLSRLRQSLFDQRDELGQNSPIVVTPPGDGCCYMKRKVLNGPKNNPRRLISCKTRPDKGDSHSGSHQPQRPLRRILVLNGAGPEPGPRADRQNVLMKGWADKLREREQVFLSERIQSNAGHRRHRVTVDNAALHRLDRLRLLRRLPDETGLRQRPAHLLQGNRSAAKDFLRGETVLAILPFETRKLPNHPLIHLKIGAHEFLGAFDTGQIGMAQMSEEMQQTLTQERLLTPLSAKGKASGPTGRGVTRCRIEGLRLTGSDGGTITASVNAVPVFHQPGPAAVPMGTPEANIISLRYAFLSQYKMVWDYPDKKIYLLKK